MKKKTIIGNGKRKWQVASLLVGMMLIATACHKEEIADGMLRVVAESEKVDTKSALAPDGRGYWVVGEEVKLLGANYSVVEENGKHYLKDVAVGNDKVMRAVYPASIFQSGSLAADGTINIVFPRTTAYESASVSGMVMQKLPVPMAAGDTYVNKNTQLVFRHLGACIAVKISNNDAAALTIDSVVVSCSQQLSGPATLNITGTFSSSPNAAVGTSSEAEYQKAAVTNIPSIASGTSQVVFVPVLKIAAATDFTIMLYRGGNVVLTQTKGSALTLDRSQMAFAPLTNSAIEGAIPVAISVSPTKKVFFSQGNLQYQASSNTWRFAENQHTVSTNNSSISSSTSNWIDLFGYGTSGYNAGQSAYQPHSTSTTASNYFQQAITGSNNKSDWGVYNAISNGGNKAGMWRTLTSDEWIYLLNPSNNASYRQGNRFAKVKIAGTRGLLIFPDAYADSTSVYITQGEHRKADGSIVNISETYAGTISFANINDRNSTFPTDDNMKLNQLNALDEKGFIFLPCHGHRESTTNKSTTGDSEESYYWTSTSATHIKFDASSMSFISGNRSWGCAVRLVRDCE